MKSVLSWMTTGGAGRILNSGEKFNRRLVTVAKKTKEDTACMTKKAQVTQRKGNYPSEACLSTGRRINFYRRARDLFKGPMGNRDTGRGFETKKKLEKRYLFRKEEIVSENDTKKDSSKF